jgi:hypothetical protein
MPDNAESSLHEQTDWVAGGVYSVTGYAGPYSVVKILLVEDGVVHLRVYADRFAIRPQQVDTSALIMGTIHDKEFGVWHLPLTASGFSEWEPRFIQHDEVLREELGLVEAFRESGARPWDFGEEKPN